MNGSISLDEAFRSAMMDAGCSPPAQIIPDGDLHRFHISGDSPGSKNGWYILFPDFPSSGIFGCWKRGIEVAFTCKGQSSLISNGSAVAKLSRDQARIYQEARRRAEQIWESAHVPRVNHPYLTRKGIKAFGIRAQGSSLIIPVRDDGQALHGIQFINAKGKKRFMTGTRKLGCYFSIGEMPTEILYICEGYATGVSIHMATGDPVAISFDAGNLLNVAKILRKKFLTVQITIAGDNDVGTEGNPGATKAKIAASAVRGHLALPFFSCNADNISDFNDLHRLEGLNAVRSQLAQARHV